MQDSETGKAAQCTTVCIKSMTFWQIETPILSPSALEGNEALHTKSTLVMGSAGKDIMVTRKGGTARGISIATYDFSFHLSIRHSEMVLEELKLNLLEAALNLTGDNVQTRSLSSIFLRI